jgi:hypothetical protein
MKRLMAAIAASTMAFSANASTKYIECRQSDEKGLVHVTFATTDDDSDKAEVKSYVTTADCAKNDTCPTSVYKKDTLPTVLRLTLTIRGSGTLQIIIDINRTDLSVVTHSSFLSSAGNSEATFAGKCEVKKIDESKKQL